MERCGRWPQGRWCAGDDETAAATRGISPPITVRLAICACLRVLTSSAEIDIEPYSVATFSYSPNNQEIFSGNLKMKYYAV